MEFQDLYKFLLDYCSVVNIHFRDRAEVSGRQSGRESPAFFYKKQNSCNRSP